MALFGSLSGLPLFVWWLGWFPGFGSFDTVVQLRQAFYDTYFNQHPAIHTVLLDVSWDVLGSPGYVGLLQLVALTVVLVVVAVRLVRIGVSPFLAVATVWLISLSPAVGATSVTLWKDVPFAIGVVWVMAELIPLAQQGSQSWMGNWPPVRMGLALAVMWLFRHNGFFTVIPLLAVLSFVVRKRLVPTVVTLGLCLLAVFGFLYRVLDVNPEAIEPSRVFIPDVAAVLVHAPDTFNASELLVIERVAPVEVWRQAYRCDNGTDVSAHPQFNDNAIDYFPGDFRRVVWKAMIGAPGEVARHRLCAGSFLFVPGIREGGYLHRPPFEFPPNSFGIERQPLSDRAYRLTRDVYVWAEADSRIWFTWSPAIPIVVASIGYAAVALRRSSRRWALPGWLLLLHIINVVATSPGHEFRYAFPLYLISLLSLPMTGYALAGRARGTGSLPTHP